MGSNCCILFKHESQFTPVGSSERKWLLSSCILTLNFFFFFCCFSNDQNEIWSPWLHQLSCFRSFLLNEDWRQRRGKSAESQRKEQRQKKEIETPSQRGGSLWGTDSKQNFRIKVKFHPRAEKNDKQLAWTLEKGAFKELKEAWRGGSYVQTDGWRTALGQRMPNLVWLESRDALPSIQTTCAGRQEALHPNQLRGHVIRRSPPITARRPARLCLAGCKA